MPPDIISDAVKKVHPSAVNLTGAGRFDHVLNYKDKGGKVKKNATDKVKVAHEVVNSPADLSILDLKPQINKLVQFIRDSNDTDPYFLD